MNYDCLSLNVNIIVLYGYENCRNLRTGANVNVWICKENAGGWGSCMSCKIFAPILIHLGGFY